MAQTKTSAKKTTTKSMRKRSAKAKLQPAVRYLRYELANSGTPNQETSHYIDLARDLSAINRRLYRQGRDYHVKKVTVVSSNTIAGIGGGFNPGFLSGAVELKQQNAGRVSLATIPDSWTARGAWVRGFQTWQRMNKVATEQTSGDIAGTWSDFKVFMSVDARVAFNASEFLIPKDNGQNNVNLGEWVMSSYISPDGTAAEDEFQIHMLGDHTGSAGAWTSVGLIKSYAESRSTVNTESPALPTDARDDPLINVFDYGTTIDDVVQNLQTQNDYPPYQQDIYPGETGNMPKPLVVQDATLRDGSATLGGFHALCGLVEIETRSPIANDVYSVLVELAPGKYRGISADVI